MTASLYIHIPFCGRCKCDYCDFYSIPVTENHATLTDSFVNALLDDVEDQLAFFKVEHIPSVYIGGGTPSVLGAARMEQLLGGLQALLKPLGEVPTEFTVEANPESADETFLRSCVNGGVNRLSLGVQSFHLPSRRAVNRGDGPDYRIEQRLALAAEYFPSALSVDLISGLPFCTEEILLSDIERVLAFKPAHVSLYSLITEPETPLGKKLTQKSAAALFLPQGDDADNIWIAGRDALEKAGLAQYEVSNFALPGKACLHNIRYWKMENWLGAGPAASGTIIDDEAGEGRRFTYPADIEAYLAAPRPRILNARTEELARPDLAKESLLMGFRYLGGPDTQLFKRRFNRPVEDFIPKTIAKWRRRGFFEKNSLEPTKNGLLFLNGFLCDAFAETGASFPKFAIKKNNLYKQKKKRKIKCS
jgi:oxygen-independent coproporphyrinogen-3 oxidase